MKFDTDSVSLFHLFVPINLHLHEKASFITVYDATKGSTVPWRIRWNGRVYSVTEVGFYHTHAESSTLYHIFSVVAGSLYFRLTFNTVSLLWLWT